MNLQRWAATTTRQARIHRDQEGERQNRHQNQQDANIAAVVPISVVTSAPLARMLGLRQYISHAAIVAARSIEPASPSIGHPPRQAGNGNHPDPRQKQQDGETIRIGSDKRLGIKPMAVQDRFVIQVSGMSRR